MAYMRSFIIGLVLVVILSVWSQFAELTIHGTQAALIYPPFFPLFIFLMLVLANASYKKLYRPHSGLNQQEFIIIFTMLVVSGTLCSIGLAQKLIPMMTGVFYYHTPATDYAGRFWSHLPWWMAPRDEKVVEDLYMGTTTGVPWGAWIFPLFVWSLVFLTIYWVMICLNSLIRKQWMDAEKLAFPLVVLPLEMCRQERGRAFNSFFRSRLMWAGFAVAFLAYLYYGLHAYIPVLPELEAVRSGYRLEFWQLEKPWNAIGTLRLRIYPFMVGLGYLFTREVAFSCWFFFLASRFEAVLGAWSGLDALKLPGGEAQFPFAGHQAAGAFIGLALVSLWMGRHGYKEVLKKVFTNKSALDDSDEPLPYRVAFFGALAGLFLLCLFSHLAGLKFIVGLLFFIIFFIFALAMTRLMSEGGYPWLQEPTWRPHYILHSLLGAQRLTQADWSVMGMHTIISYDNRYSLMPRAMQQYKMVDSAGADWSRRDKGSGSSTGQSRGLNLNSRHLTAIIFLTIVVTLIVSYWSFLRTSYEYGGLNINPFRFSTLAKHPGSWMDWATKETALPKADRMSLAFIAVGLAKIIFLSIMRVRFLWWPFHPVGFAAANISFVRSEWFSVFIAWAFKTLSIRYGGLSGYKKLRPFFLGLVLGTVAVAGFWLILDGFTMMRDHKVIFF